MMEVQRLSIMIKMLKSDTAESQERQIARIKKEIETLTNDLQMREAKLEKLKNKDSPVNVVGILTEDEIPNTAEVV